MGLEDLEGCERCFSKSNALAASLRYASIFHRKQAISTYFKHNDSMEVYQNLSKFVFPISIHHNLLICPFIATFLYNNYKQALDILSSGPTALSQAMVDLKISDTQVFEEWREEERVYLEGLQKEPITETLEMEYYQKLVNLHVSE
jgi:hypothetical protein